MGQPTDRDAELDSPQGAVPEPAVPGQAPGQTPGQTPEPAPTDETRAQAPATDDGTAGAEADAAGTDEAVEDAAPGEKDEVPVEPERDDVPEEPAAPVGQDEDSAEPATAADQGETVEITTDQVEEAGVATEETLGDVADEAVTEPVEPTPPAAADVPEIEERPAAETPPAADEDVAVVATGPADGPTGDGAAEAPADAVATVEGQADAAAPEPAPAPEASTGTDGDGPPAAEDDDEDEPYVPRVFAFDPSVPAVLVPPPASEVQPAAATGDPGAEPADAPAAEPDAAAPDATGQAAAVPVAQQPDAEQTAVVPVVPVEPAAEAAPGATEPTPTTPVDATQVIPPVDPWSRPAPVVRTSVRPAAPAGTEAAAAPTATPAVAPAAGLGSAFGPVPPDDSREASPFEGFEEEAPRRGWVRGLLWTGVGVLVLGGLYTGAQWFYSDKVPSGTSVAGVDVGGLTRTAAQDTLEAELGPRAAEPVTLAAGEASTTLDPAAAGLTFDAAATAEELTAFSMSPARLWQHLFGGEDEAPVVAVDDAALDAQVEALRGSLEIAPVDGAVQFVDGAPTSTPAADGSALVTDEVPAVITTSWLVTDGPVTLPTEPVEPAITQEETDAGLAQAEKVVSAPVVVSVGGQNAELPPEAIAAAASFPATDGVLTLTFDGAMLVDSVVDRTNDLLTAADDAHFVFQDGAPVIEGGEPGTTIDPAALSAAVTTAASGDERTATVELVESDPEQSVAALEALGIKEKVSEFSTPVPNVPVRTANLRRGAEKVTGTLVKPGETFSLVDTLSPITLEGGYFAAGIVESGRHTEGVGGGLSQMATTTYNAGFFAGLEDVEHRPHSYWFERYPAGREATIFVGSIDMKFKNDTPYGVLMQSWVGGGELHVAIWSTKYYDVETSSSGKSNVVQPTTVTHSGADCAPTPAGTPGFSITNYRKVYREGELVKDESYRWTYKPDNAVVCE
jgi:vancomycin resistance protein YoaR